MFIIKSPHRRCCSYCCRAVTLSQSSIRQQSTSSELGGAIIGSRPYQPLRSARGTRGKRTREGRLKNKLKSINKSHVARKKRGLAGDVENDVCFHGVDIDDER